MREIVDTGLNRNRKMETPNSKRRKLLVSSNRSPLSVVARRQLLKKLLPSVSPLLKTWSSSMQPIVSIVENEYRDLSVETNDEEHWMVISR